MNISSHKNLAAQRGFCQRPDVPTTIQHRNRGKTQPKRKKKKRKGGKRTKHNFSGEKAGKEKSKGPNKIRVHGSGGIRDARHWRTGQKKKKKSRTSTQDNKAVHKPVLHYTIKLLAGVSALICATKLPPQTAGTFLQHLAARCWTDGPTD